MRSRSNVEGERERLTKCFFFAFPRAQPGKVVVVLQGRYAGKKAVIVKNNDDGTSSRNYGHALVCGLSTIPRKVRAVETMMRFMCARSFAPGSRARCAGAGEPEIGSGMKTLFCTRETLSVERLSLERALTANVRLFHRIKQVTKKMDEKKQAKRSRCKVFIKNINYSHLMPTRYTLDVDFKGKVSSDVLDNSTKKIAAQKEAKALLEERFKTGKSRWFFTRLAF